MKKTLVVIVVSILFLKCSRTEKIFSRTYENEFNVENGYEVFDSLNTFSFKIPSKKNWKPFKYYNGRENSVTSGLEIDSLYYVFGVNRLKHISNLTLKEEQEEIEDIFNVTEKGKILLNNEYHAYNLVLGSGETQEYTTLFVTIYDSKNEYIYTLSSSVNSRNEYLKHIQRTIPLFESFKILEK